MPRARNIKPGFFKNEDLADISFIGRLLFVGLWTLADCKGRLEYRSRRIKAELFPYDDGIETDKELIALDQSGFISIYSVKDQKYIEVLNFGKHQNPHKNERDKGSQFPDKPKAPEVVDSKEFQNNLDLSGLDRNQDGINPADSLLLNPESLLLIPESGTTESSSDTPGGGLDEYAFRSEVFNINQKDFHNHRELYPTLNLISEYSQIATEIRDKPKKQIWGALNAKLNYRNNINQPGNQQSFKPKLSTVEQSLHNSAAYAAELQQRHEHETRNDNVKPLGVVNN